MKLIFKFFKRLNIELITNYLLNDFVFELPVVGPCAVGLAGDGGGYIGGIAAGNTHGSVLNFLENGLNNWSATDSGIPSSPDDEGIMPQDQQSDDDVDATVTAFNNSIKIVGVEIDKMRAYRFILHNREGK